MLNNELFEIFKMVEPLIKFQKQIEPALEIQKTVKQLDELTKNNFDHLIKLKPIEEQLKSIQSFYERINKIITDTPEYLLLLAEYGWYLEYESELSLPLDLAEQIQNNDVEEVDVFLIDYYSDNFERILSELSRRHPVRALIFSQISLAYKSKLYSICIPSVLSQVDGICFDFTKKKFFIKNNRNQRNPYLPQIANEIANISDSLFKSFLSPIYRETPINAMEDNIKNYPINLNRHAIIHGSDTEYGTKINCLKCISLLKYISDILIADVEYSKGDDK